MRSEVVKLDEVNNWTPDLRTTGCFNCSWDARPARPNAYRYPRAVEVVSFRFISSDKQL